MAGLARRFEPLPGLRREALRIGVRVVEFFNMAAMPDPPGDHRSAELNHEPPVETKPENFATRFTSDAGLLAHRELDNATDHDDWLDAGRCAQPKWP